MQPKPETPDPKPIDGEDFYTDRLQSYTVTISVTVGGMEERDSEEDICLKAIGGLRNGTLDGDPEIVFTTNIRTIEYDFETDKPFDRKAWRHYAQARRIARNARPRWRTSPRGDTRSAGSPHTLRCGSGDAGGRFRGRSNV